jgi:hypothetical protein
MSIKISKWYYRFGNNVIQLINAIRYSLDTNDYFQSPNHHFFSNIETNIDKKSNIECVRKLFYYEYKHIGFDDTSKYICKKYLYPNLKNITNLSKSDNDTLHIHIRSGDVFYNKPHKSYVQNPLYYFNQIIDKYKNIIVISQDTSNPVIKELIKEQPKIEFKIGRSLEEDLSELLSATNICSGGVGSFVPCIALLSNKLENLYISNIQHPMFKFNFTEKYFNISETFIDPNRYIKLGYWKNTHEQRKLMIEYKP